MTPRQKSVAMTLSMTVPTPRFSPDFFELRFLGAVSPFLSRDLIYVFMFITPFENSLSHDHDRFILNMGNKSEYEFMIYYIYLTPKNQSRHVSIPLQVVFKSIKKCLNLIYICNAATVLSLVQYEWYN